MTALFRILLAVNIFTLLVSFAHLSDPAVSNVARAAVGLSVPLIAVCICVLCLERRRQR